MKLDDFDPPILAEKSSVQYKREIFGDNWERMTPQKLKWLIALSGPANDQYYGKGETRHGPGPNINDRQFPTKAKREKTSKPRTGKNSMVVGPGGEPSKPFDDECDGNNACIAKKAKSLVDQYFAEKPPGQPLSRPLHPKDTQRKRAKMPRLTLGPDGEPIYKANRPTGTYAQTGKKRRWGGVQISTSKSSYPKIADKQIEKLAQTGAKEKPEQKFKQPKIEKGAARRRERRVRDKSKEKKPTKKPTPEQQASAEQARRKAIKQQKARGGPNRPELGTGGNVPESRNYISTDYVDENIIQALYG